jgi:hypothetical protein
MPPRPPGASKARTSDRIYVDGHYYWPEIGGVGDAEATMIANRLYAIPFIVGRPTSFLGAIWEGAASTPAGKVWFGVYDHDEGAGRPSNLIASPTGFLPVAPQFLSWVFPGGPLTIFDAVWFVAVFDSAVIMKTFAPATSFREAPLGSLEPSPSATDLFAGLSAPLPFGGLPAVFPTAAPTYLPAGMLPRFGLAC